MPDAGEPVRFLNSCNQFAPPSLNLAGILTK
jgi:hypothetical protein